MDLGIIQKLLRSEPPDFARILSCRAGVIQDVSFVIPGDLAFAYEDHTVKRHVIGELAEEEEIAGQGAGELARDEVGIEAPEGFRVGELGEGSVVEVGGAEGAWTYAKERRTERRVGVVIFGDGIEGGD